MSGFQLSEEPRKWSILKAIYLIALLHIQMKTQLICLKVLRYIKYFETRSKHLLYGIKRGGGGGGGNV